MASLIDWLIAGILMGTTVTLTMGFFGSLSLFGLQSGFFDTIMSLIYAALGGMLGIEIVSMSGLLA